MILSKWVVEHDPIWGKKVRVQIVHHPTPRSLCEDFIDRAIVTWNWIEKSEITGINISEDSITDFNLLELQTKHPDEIKTQKFTRRKEARVGADWEWWLGSEGFWLGLRVQAKKISPANLIYPYLDEANEYGKQVDLLINHSLNNNPPMIPIYVLYNNWDINQFDPPWLCGTYSKLIELLGCGVSHAISVKSILDQGSKNLKDIASTMYPWSCLVCCRGFSKENEKLPFRAFDFLLGGFRDHIKRTNFDLSEREKFVSQRAPSYVYRILEGVKLSEREWDEIKVNRITVIYEK